MIQEIWKDILGYDGKYQVSNFGNVKSLKYGKEKILKPSDNGGGYYMINLCKDGKLKSIKIHILVAMVFLNHKPDGTTRIVIDHINNNPSDNRVENLQLISHRENCSKDRKGGSSKYVGVHFNKRNDTWQSRISIDGKRKTLGVFNTEIEAHEAYQNALKMYHKGDLSFMQSKKQLNQ
jgi:hypothetical protein